MTIVAGRRGATSAQQPQAAYLDGALPEPVPPAGPEPVPVAPAVPAPPGLAELPEPVPVPGVVPLPTPVDPAALELLPPLVSCRVMPAAPMLLLGGVLVLLPVVELRVVV